MDRNPPQFIYFDLGNVLFMFEHGIACERVGEVAGVSPERVREVFFDDGIEWDYERGELTTQQFYDRFCEATSTQPDKDRFLYAVGDMFTMNVKMVPLLASLWSAGHRLGVLSNTCEAHWKYIYEGHFTVVRELFETYVLSYEVKAMKPDAAIYQAASEAAGVAAEDIFFMDDMAENVLGAQRFGFDAVQFKSPQQLARELVERGVRFNY